MFLEHARAEQFHGRVQAGLATECGKQHELAVSADFFQLRQFADDNFLHCLGRDRLNVGAIGKFRVGHDRGGVGIHQHHAVAFFLKRLASLRSRIIKLTRLPNNNRASADNQNRMNVVSSRHEPRET